MLWVIKFADIVEKQLVSLSSTNQKRVRNFLTERVAILDNPRSIGEALVGKQFSGLWKYRLGYIRIICQIKDKEITILVVKIGNRREIYKKR